MRVILKGFENFRVSYAEDLKSMPLTSDLEIELLGSGLLVWGRNRLIGQVCLCAAVVIPSNTPATNETSGRSKASIPSASRRRSTSRPIRKPASRS